MRQRAVRRCRGARVGLGIAFLIDTTGDMLHVAHVRYNNSKARAPRNSTSTQRGRAAQHTNSTRTPRSTDALTSTVTGNDAWATVSYAHEETVALRKGDTAFCRKFKKWCYGLCGAPIERRLQPLHTPSQVTERGMFVRATEAPTIGTRDCRWMRG